jgi:hypothetical protein
MRNKILRISNEKVISMFFVGFTDIKMKEKLSMNDELTSVVRLFEIADRSAKAEEGRLFMHTLPEAPPLKSKPMDPKCNKADVLSTEPKQKHRREDRSGRDKGGRRRYCILHKRDTHSTDDCWVVQKFDEENGMKKCRGGNRSYGRSSSRGDHCNNSHDEDN